MEQFTRTIVKVRVIIGGDYFVGHGAIEEIIDRNGIGFVYPDTAFFGTIRG